MAKFDQSGASPCVISVVCKKSSESGVVLHRLLERWLHGKHPLVDRRGIVPIERDHLSAGFTAPDDFERALLDAFDRGIRDGGGWFAAKPKLRASSIRLHHRR